MHRDRARCGACVSVGWCEDVWMCADGIRLDEGKTIRDYSHTYWVYSSTVYLLQWQYMCDYTLSHTTVSFPRVYTYIYICIYRCIYMSTSSSLLTYTCIKWVTHLTNLGYSSLWKPRTWLDLVESVYSRENLIKRVNGNLRVDLNPLKK